MIVIAGMLTSSCGPSIRVYSDYDRDYNIREFTTYLWASAEDIESKNNPLYYNELNDKRIKSSVDDILKNKGYKLVNENPSMVAHYHIIVEDYMEITTDPYGYYGPYWSRTRTYSYNYRQGTLIIDFMDSENKHLLWRGWAVSVLDEDNTSEKTEVMLRTAIADILAKFPATSGINN